MLNRMLMMFLALLVAPAVMGSQSITHTQKIALEGRGLDEVMMLARERALEYAMEELPALVMGQERLTNDAYSRVIENWQLAGLRHEFVSTNISHGDGIAEFISHIHYDKDAVVQALVEVSSAKRLASEAEQVYDSIRDIEAGTLSEHFLRQANAAYESAQNRRYSDNDERMINVRLAQEKVLAEAMKDVYMHYMIPAIQALRVSDVEVETRRPTFHHGLGNPRYTTTLTYTPRLEPVRGAKPNRQGLITWDVELNAILKPYQDRHPFINIATIIERMSVCSATGDVIINGNHHARPGYRRGGSRRSIAYSDGYHTTLRELRPAYNPDTMRRKETRLVIAHDGSIAKSLHSISNEALHPFELRHGHGSFKEWGADYYYHKNGNSIGICIH